MTADPPCPVCGRVHSDDEACPDDLQPIEPEELPDAGEEEEE